MNIRIETDFFKNWSIEFNYIGAASSEALLEYPEYLSNSFYHIEEEIYQISCATEPRFQHLRYSYSWNYYLIIHYGYEFHQISYVADTRFQHLQSSNSWYYELSAKTEDYPLHLKLRQCEDPPDI